MSRRPIDDTDPAVTYSPEGGWSRHGVIEEFNSTTSRADVPGGVAVVRFTGTGIQVLGTIAAINANNTVPTSRYVVDSNSTTASVYRGTQLQNDARRNITFYQILDLPHGPHFLTITQESGELWLDWFVIFGENNPNTSPGNGPTQTPQSSSTDAPSTGAIVGGVVGGVAFIAALLVGFFLLWRRKKAKRPRVSVNLDPSPVDPFLHAPRYEQPQPQPQYQDQPHSQYNYQPEMHSLTSPGYLTTSFNPQAQQQQQQPQPQPVLTSNYAQSSYSSNYATSSAQSQPPLPPPPQQGSGVYSKAREAASERIRDPEGDAPPPPAYSAAS
ncbi:hypothetical protein FA15DRAFT_706521 [Coprinopsis marcescibilis]|uniref:Uncharacterized protein n=1 Tax=Coprinopsis marcescibilis TaxID=230819 RepID=A0A5C3KPF4_COPMA|nr:hypothetical protein FA15DRAFT_706521 [Coprinopsis marcescibilis]